jgi:hypothetical protein
MDLKSISCLLLNASLLAFIAIGHYGFAAERPDWIDNPGIGTVGSASTHVRGSYAQEELAIARARSRLAARLGVEVNSVQQIRESVANEQSSVASQKETTQEITNKTVKAFTQARWYDKERDIIYVLVVPGE